MAAKPVPARREATDVDRRSWGGVARRGARQVVAPPPADGAARRSREPERSAPEPWEPEEWVRDVDPLRHGASDAVARGARPAGSAPPPRRRRAPAQIAAELAQAVGERRAPKLEQRLVEAARAFERGRAQDAHRIVRPLADQAPDVPAVRELAGLALYRLGRWAQAISHLEAFGRLTSSVEQHPVLADSYRALGRHAKVEALWDELRRASPGPELVTEGRIVMAGSLADRGELAKAIALLERGPVAPRRRPAQHHLRLWYALADLYERAGDAPRARQLFTRIAAVDPDLADTADRLHALG
jgi:tetratricopeptide (TPR) repeat protein